MFVCLFACKAFRKDSKSHRRLGFNLPFNFHCAPLTPIFSVSHMIVRGGLWSVCLCVCSCVCVCVGVRMYFAQPSIYVHLALEISTFVGGCLYVCLCILCVSVCVCVCVCVCRKNIYIKNLGHLIELKYPYSLSYRGILGSNKVWFN